MPSTTKGSWHALAAKKKKSSWMPLVSSAGHLKGVCAPVLDAISWTPRGYMLKTPCWAAGCLPYVHPLPSSHQNQILFMAANVPCVPCSRGILKSRDITLPTKVHLVKVMVFPVVMHGCESWTIRKPKHQRMDVFELWCWRRLLRVPWTARKSN